MKITEKRLKQIIKEEMERALAEKQLEHLAEDAPEIEVSSGGCDGEVEPLEDEVFIIDDEFLTEQ